MSDSPTDPAASTTTRSPQGLWFEDLSLTLRVETQGRTLTESDVVQFAALSGDWNPIHVDAVAAARTPFRGRVAHGMLVMSAATGLAVQTGIFHGTLSALAGMEIDWQKPVRLGDTIRVLLEVLQLQPDPGPKRGTVELGVSVLNQEEVQVAQARWRTVFLRDPARRR